MRRWMYLLLFVINLAALGISIAEQNVFNAWCFSITLLIVIFLEGFE